jgi:hypothetical protein
VFSCRILIYDLQFFFCMRRKIAFICNRGHHWLVEQSSKLLLANGIWYNCCPAPAAVGIHFFIRLEFKVRFFFLPGRSYPMNCPKPKLLCDYSKYQLHMLVLRI